MNEKLREKYYLVQFKILQKEYDTFWYTDDDDGFMLDTDNTLKSFPTKEQAVAFADKEGFMLDTEAFLVSTSILKDMNIREINCKLYLNYWNIFSDVANSINEQFLGDSRNGTIRHIYEKLFYGCNILVKKDEEHYIPKWSKSERRWIARVIKNGFQIVSKGLSTD